MRIFIGDKHYFASQAAVTLLRSRALFGTSFVSEFLKSGIDPRPALVRLVYVSLEDARRPCWDDYISTVHSLAVRRRKKLDYEIWAAIGYCGKMREIESSTKEA